jgi:hypothetical protein
MRELRFNAVAIFLLFIPIAAILRISSSREVSTLSSGPDERLTEFLMAFFNTECSIFYGRMDSPDIMECIALDISSPKMLLVRYPEAQASSILKTRSLLSYVERANMQTSGLAVFIRLVASSPSIPGRHMSIITTSGTSS